MEGKKVIGLFKQWDWHRVNERLSLWSRPGKQMCHFDLDQNRCHKISESFLDIILRVKFLGHRVGIYLIFLETGKNFSKFIVLFKIPSNTAYESQFLHTHAMVGFVSLVNLMILIHA